jgi:hypothetical protein
MHQRVSTSLESGAMVPCSLSNKKKHTHKNSSGHVQLQKIMTNFFFFFWNRKGVLLIDFELCDIMWCSDIHVPFIALSCVFLLKQTILFILLLFINDFECQTFRKTLTSMFREELDLDVIFFETAMYLRKFPHMVMECVPVPRETGDLAPIYFKVN